MKCADCTFESDNEHDFAYTSTDRMTEPRCMTCFLPAIERRIKSVENTLHKKSCILCKYKGYAKDFVSTPVAPTKLICKHCVKELSFIAVREKVMEELK